MIKIDDLVIPKREFDLACSEYQQRMRKPALSKEEQLGIANQIVDARLLLDESKKAGLTVEEKEIQNTLEYIKKSYQSEENFQNALKMLGDTEEVFKEKIKEDILLKKYVKDQYYDKVAVKEEEMEQFFKANESRFVADEKINASHILFNEGDKEKAEKVKEEIDNGADFAEMAKENSQCPSKEQGGNLGFFGKGQMVPEFETAAFTLAKGEVSGLVKTQFGYHIIKLNEKEESKKMSFEESKKSIESHLQNQMVNEMMGAALDKLRANVQINIDESQFV